jgi:hypothetical protein
LISYAYNSIFSDPGFSSEVFDISFSAYDIKLETVRDFGRFLSLQLGSPGRDIDLEMETPDQMELNACEMKDNSDDPIQVRNLTKIPIRDYNEVQNLIET